MEQTRNINLPIIGMVQHGMQIQNPNGTKRAKELGHFIARIQDNYMQKFLQKFDDLYKGKTYIEIEFVNDNPLTKKYVRYNQGGDACHCLEGSTTGSQKTKNGWQPIECNTYECQYRQKNASGKTACNRIGWLKFFIPSISTDRIWLMKITGQTSINRIDSYINIQKIQGNSLKGRYVLFLKQEEQESKTTGQKFNNFILDILKKEDFLLEQTTPKTSTKPQDLSTTNANIVNNHVATEVNTEPKNTVINNKSETPKENTTSSTKEATTQKKATKSKTKKTKDIEIIENPNFDNCYMLVGRHIDKFLKDGQPKEYYVGTFHDMKDNPIDIIISPEFIDSVSTCGLGTIVELDIKEFGNKKIAMGLKYVEIKNIAA